MGLMKKPSPSIYERPGPLTPPVPPNPNPADFQIEKTEVVGLHVIACLRYPQCPTWEGLKVLVFAYTTERAVRAARVLDPHFAPPGPGRLIPVARFEPTARGWQLARVCAAALGD